MLFTQATAAGIQLENAIILSPEQYKKAQIPANNKRIMEWAKDNHVNISIGVQPSSDLNCMLDIMMDDRVSDNTMSTNKKMLRHLGDDLIKLIDNMSDKVEEAVESAEINKKLNMLLDDFRAGIKALCGENTMVHVEIFKLQEVTSDEVINLLVHAINNIGES